MYSSADVIHYLIASNRRRLAQTEPKLVSNLISLMDSPSLKVQCQAALALRNLASDDKYQIEIVQKNGLPPLLRLLRSSFLPLILSAAACVRNVSIHPLNESPIIDSGFLQPLIELLAYEENEEVQCHAISTLRNLAASSEKNKLAIVEAGAVERIKSLVLTVPLSVQSEMTACAAVLGLSGELSGHFEAVGQACTDAPARRRYQGTAHRPWYSRGLDSTHGIRQRRGARQQRSGNWQSLSEGG